MVGGVGIGGGGGRELEYKETKVVFDSGCSLAEVTGNKQAMVMTWHAANNAIPRYCTVIRGGWAGLQAQWEEQSTVVQTTGGERW